MQAARAAGAIAVGALWGMFARDELITAGAQYEATTISALPRTIQEITR
jgi:phosphoglycolate phosphatase-like HAD superfamily hydrolase